MEKERQVQEKLLELLSGVPAHLYRVTGTVALFCDHYIDREIETVELVSSTSGYPLLVKSIANNNATQLSMVLSHDKVDDLEVLTLKVIRIGFGLIIVKIYIVDDKTYDNYKVKRVGLRDTSGVKVNIISHRMYVSFVVKYECSDTLQKEEIKDLVKLLELW